VRQRVAQQAAAVHVPEWKPKSHVKIAADDAEAKAQAEASASAAPSDEDEDVVKRLLGDMPAPAAAGASANAGLCNVVDFEKDDDRNFHIDLIYAAANIRATQYKIKAVDRLQSKLIAGKIIPAIITTTAAATGLVCLELYKLVQNKPKIEAYRNTFVNLALPVFQQGEPVPPKKTKFLGKDITIWDRLDVRQGDITLQQCLDYLKKTYELDVDILGVGESLVYSGWMPPAKKTERLGKKLTELIVEITKKPLKKGVHHLTVEVTATHKGEDVDVPPVTVFF